MRPDAPSPRFPTIIAAARKVFPWLCICSITLFHATGNYLWLSLHTLPPHDDLAFHLRAALEILDKTPHPLLLPLTGWSSAAKDFYPTFFHTVMALFNGFGDRSETCATMANVPFMLVLLVSLYYSGRKLGSGGAGLLAGALTLFYPYMFDLSRLPLPDFAMTAMIALSFCLLLYTEEFSRRAPSLLFGLSFGLGMLTKQVFIFFMYAPLAALLLWMAKEGQFADRQRRTNLFLALGLAVLPPLLWYIPRLHLLWPKYMEAAYVAPGYVGLPPIFSIDSLLFYYRYLIAGQMGPFYILLFVAGLLVLLATAPFKHLLLLLAAIIGPYAGFFFVYTKHCKTTVPYLSFFALITALGLMRLPSRIARALLFGGILIVGTCQYFDISYQNDAWHTAFHTIPAIDNLLFRRPQGIPFRTSFAPVNGGGVSERVRTLLRVYAPPVKREVIILITNNIPWKDDNDMAVNMEGMRYLLKHDLYRKCSVISIPHADYGDFMITTSPLEERYDKSYVLLEKLAMPDASEVFVYKARRFR